MMVIETMVLFRVSFFSLLGALDSPGVERAHSFCLISPMPDGKSQASGLCWSKIRSGTA